MHACTYMCVGRLPFEYLREQVLLWVGMPEGVAGPLWWPGMHRPSLLMVVSGLSHLRQSLAAICAISRSVRASGQLWAGVSQWGVNGGVRALGLPKGVKTRDV